MSRPVCREPRLQERYFSPKKPMLMSNPEFPNAPCRELELKGKSEPVRVE